MKFIVAPDSFKTTASSERISEIISEKIRAYFNDADIISLPLADGGEGSVQFFKDYCGGNLISLSVTDAFFNKKNASYVILEKEKTAIIEMAACAGFSEDHKGLAPMYTTTFGVGEMILDAIEKGCEKITVCLGGSCTNDFGLGMAAALGISFLDENEEEFIPVGATMENVSEIDVSNVSGKLKNVKFTAMCDVENPIYGENGAAYVFARQKGANDEQIELLDKGLIHICKVVKENLGLSVDFIKGSGAAGGMGGGMVAFLDAKLQSGIDTVLDILDFDNMISDADFIFTGEGRLDMQSLSGKAVGGISKRAKKQNIPVIVICGEYDNHLEEYYKLGVSAVFSINTKAQNFEESKYKTEENLSSTIENILRTIKIGRN